MIPMKHYIKYIKYLTTHKFWVMYYCFKEGLYWRGIMHDINKFTLRSIKAYARYFYMKNGRDKFIRDKSGYYDASQTGGNDFDLAWLHHQHTNKHHWQYWTMVRDDGTFRCLDMPMIYIREMICDWRGAGRAQGTNPTGGYAEIVNYYNINRDKMHFTSDTRHKVERIIVNKCLDEGIEFEIEGWHK